MAIAAYPLANEAIRGGIETDISLLTWYEMFRKPYSSFFTKVGANGGHYSRRGLVTAEVDGCTVLIARLRNDGVAHGLMTHYLSLDVCENIRGIRRMMRRHEEMASGGKNVRLFYDRIYERMAGMLEEKVMRAFGGNTKLIKVPYGGRKRRKQFTGTEGILMFSVPTGQYWFQPWTEEDFNPDFHGFL